jgi:hypothetical protein
MAKSIMLSSSSAHAWCGVLPGLLDGRGVDHHRGPDGARSASGPSGSSVITGPDRDSRRRRRAARRIAGENSAEDQERHHATDQPRPHRAATAAGQGDDRRLGRGRQAEPGVDGTCAGGTSTSSGSSSV